MKEIVKTILFGNSLFVPPYIHQLSHLFNIIINIQVEVYLSINLCLQI